MLNDRLRLTDLVDDLKDFINEIDIITDEISGIKPIPLRFDQKTLGKIHHALNIENYEKSEFRNRLLLRAEKDDLITFFHQVNLIPDSKDDLSVTEIVSFCKKASELPWSNNIETKSFVEIFGYETSLIPTTKIIRKNIEIASVVKKDDKTGAISLILDSEQPFRQLFPYQAEIFFEADGLIETKHTRLIIQMPTGSGKTRTAMEIISHFLNRGVLDGKERQVLWLADKEELLEQAIESFKNVFPHLGLRDARIYRLWERYESEKIENNSITMAGYSKLKNLLKKNPSLIKPNLIICDEAHNAIAHTYKPLIEDLTDDGARVIGLTATPVRAAKSKENTELKEFFYKKIIDIDPRGSENAIIYLQRHGYLSHVHKYVIDATDIDYSIPVEILRLASTARDLPERYLEILARNNARNLLIAKKLIDIGHQKKRTLYFGTSIWQSKLICAILILSNINAVHIDGDTPIDYRRDAIRKFKNGEIDVICNYNVFTTGFDEPKLEVVMIGRPTKSIVLHQQMIGRGMRGPKMGGTREFDLYRINEDLPSIELADSYFTDFWLQ